MFSWFKKNTIISNNTTKIEQWKEEHKQMIKLFDDVLLSYNDNNIEETKKSLLLLNQIVLRHLLDEDITFAELIKFAKRSDPKIVDQIQEFRFSFRGVKVALLKFLTKYNTPEETLDKDFLPTLQNIIDSLKKRIGFEETNLYIQLNN